MRLGQGGAGDLRSGSRIAPEGCYPMAVHEDLARTPKPPRREVGLEQAGKLAKVAGANSRVHRGAQGKGSY